MVSLPPDAKVWQVFNAQKRMQEEGPGAENVFCLDGRVMMGPAHKAWQPVATAHLVVFPIVLFCAFEGPALPVIFGTGEFNILLWIPVVLGVIAVVSLFITAGSDPGVLLRSSDPSIMKEAMRREEEQGWKFTQARMDGKLQDLKFCRTCKIWRTPRTTHCQVCDNCVEGFDHHCPWVGTCIGERNYRQFCIFVFSTAAVTLYLVVISCVVIARDDSPALSDRLQRHWAAMFCACYGTLFSLFIEILAACHCCLVRSYLPLLTCASCLL